MAVLAIKRVFSKEFYPIVKVSGPSEKSEDFDKKGSDLCAHTVQNESIKPVRLDPCRV